MKAILRQTGLLMLFFGGVYLFFLMLSTYQLSKTDYVDVWQQGASIKDCFRYFALDAYRLRRSTKPKLIIVGGSSTGMGFRPEDLQPLFPDYEIADLALPGATAEEVRQTMEIVQQLLPEDVLRKSVFVMGMVYHTLTVVSDGPGPRVNRFLVETGLYRWDGEKVRPVVPAQYMDLLVRTLRPYFYLQHALRRNGLNAATSYVPRFLRDSEEGLDEFQQERPLTDFLEEYHPLTDEEKAHWVRWLGAKCDLESTAGFEEMLTMCRLSQEKGNKLVLVDVPVAEWHKQMSPAHKNYEMRKKPYIEEALKYPNVRYINLVDLPELADETMFVDGVHARKEMSKVWCRALKERWDSNVAAGNERERVSAPPVATDSTRGKNSDIRSKNGST